MPTSPSESICAVCGKSFPRRSLYPLAAVRPKVREEIENERPGLDHSDFICKQDLARSRMRYVQGLLVSEKGELSDLEVGVVESMKNHELMATDVSETFAEKLTLGQRLADRIAIFGCSWTFLITFFSLLLVWIGINGVVLLARPFDPYPFILLNLLLSCIAAIQAPVIMIAFVPRAFSLTHINLTHRNWTAVGFPDIDALPLVDPRGLVTPHYDGWSIDAWIVPEEGQPLFPSRAEENQCVQKLLLEDGLVASTRVARDSLELESEVWVDGDGTCRIKYRATSPHAANLVVTLRPYNPEGIFFLHSVSLDKARTTWSTDENRKVSFSAPPHTNHISNYERGDIAIHLGDLTDEHHGKCKVGMTTAAALFAIPSHEPLELEVTVPLETKNAAPISGWDGALSSAAKLRVPDQRLQRLYNEALRTVVLCSPDDAFPGTFTYKRFWFRDAAYMVFALLQAGLIDRAERAVGNFFKRQKHNGYFHSQDGEWDSNGQALWTMEKLCQFKGCAPPKEWIDAITSGVGWIKSKRIRNADGKPHQGLLPAGFSAEHLGANDFYYWDDFWSVSGLESASRMLEALGRSGESAACSAEAEDLTAAIQRSLVHAYGRLRNRSMPAAPGRRMDAGSIGSIVSGYPLQIDAPDCPELLNTVEFLLQNCWHEGAFFQDMVHSGVNPYLTLHLAQILMRAGDLRYAELRDAVANLATSTGQWPEAIHPRTGGGCMGDGQHAWAAAEWISMMRHSFVREEGDDLVLGAGIDEKWFASGETFGISNAPTTFGRIDLCFEPSGDSYRVRWHGNWHREPASLSLEIPSLPPLKLNEPIGDLELKQILSRV
ncbi:MAG: hypothetical protein ACI9R3_002213 [Verrucomicrobiales bacterium]|jgi:hypothetical protein